ncbi:hypothetical protein QFC20_004893 [Naganishia adeliensis]|uniref:Uncharacterized protein n=1 Tax=Naganishia adeliensis TaxID=92952 RepID=A0ACC2VVK3_9TREE|nr:hypothetical protein QFC20_004893 [Naganishia adeliensis]
MFEPPHSQISAASAPVISIVKALTTPMALQPIAERTANAEERRQPVRQMTERTRGNHTSVFPIIAVLASAQEA